METQDIYKNVTIAANQLVKEKEYWLDKLSGELTRSYFPYDFAYKKPMDGEYPRDEVFFKISGEIQARIKEITAGEYPQLQMVLTAAVAALLARYTGNLDIMVGTSIDRQEIQGALINTILPLRILLTGNMTFKELLLEVRTVINEAIENQNYPVETLPSHPAEMLEVGVLLENIQERTYISHLGTGINFYFQAHENETRGEVAYDASRYEEESIKRIIDHLLQLMRIALFKINLQINQIPLLSDEDRETLDRFNRTRSHYPHQKTIHELFSAQAGKTPGNIALIENENPGHGTVTYGQLDERTNRLSRFLTSQGVKPGDIIALLMEPSVELVSAIIAILKSGCAYLPLDIDYPAKRKLYILNHSGAKLLLTRKAQVGDLDWPGKILYLEEIELPGAGKDEGGTPAPANRQYPSSLAYVIYTSGSTGKPKGVAVEHRALVNYTWWAAKNYIGSEKVNVPLYTSIAFDLTVTSIFPPLVTGNTVIIYRGQNREFLVEKIIEENKVEVVKLTPVHLMLISERSGRASKIKRFIVGGEALETPLAREIHDNFQGNIEIYNEYGPTEATVGCMIYKFDPLKDRGDTVPIGIPAHNVQIYLLDRNDEEVPPGGIGELAAAGDGLARGYLNNPELTQYKFQITNKPGYDRSHRSYKSYILYKTGDLGRRLPDGNIQFLGRADHQVKIRGYRVETSEIEYCLLKHPQIRQAAVAAYSSATGYQYLAAYIVPHGSDINSEQLREYTAAGLPEFMIPSYFILLDKLPVTINGKLDRKALPEPDKHTEDTRRHYTPPTSGKEEILANIWQEVMGIDRVGIDDNYFNLGGDSIKAIQLSARLQKYNLKLDIGDLFRYPNIRELSNYVKPVKEKANQDIITGQVPLTPIQHWFFQLNLEEMHHFNQSMMLYRPETFDKRILEKVLNKLLEHHDALRMVFLTEQAQIKQVNRGNREKLIEVPEYEINQEPYEKIIEEKCNQIQAGIDMTRGPLVKPALFKTKKGDYLLIAIHHLIIDGVSWRILLEDFTTLYQQLEGGGKEQDLEIPLKTTSYKEWAENLEKYANSGEFLKQLAYWRDLEKTAPLHLGKTETTRYSQNKNSGRVFFRLTEENTEKLLKQVNQAYNTEINDILLAAAGLAFSDWRELDRIPMVLEGHGRENILPALDINRTVGWFTTVYPVVLEMKNKHDIGAVIKDTKEMLRNIPHKGIGYGILKYLTAKEHKHGIEMKLNPAISFNYLGQVDKDITSGVYRAAEISAGNPMSLNSQIIYPIYIMGMVFDKRLRISVSYDRAVYKEKEMQDLVKGYEKRLQQIIHHCTAKQETELTVSDLSSAIEKEEKELVLDILSQVTLEE